MKRLLILLLFLPITTFSQIRDLVGTSGGIYSYYQIRELIDGCDLYTCDECIRCEFTSILQSTEDGYIDNTLIETIKFNGNVDLELLEFTDLEELCGCHTYIYKEYNKDGWYQFGEANDRECKGSFRGATYTTSQFRIYEDRILSWNVDVQICGFTKGAYKYLKIK